LALVVDLLALERVLRVRLKRELLGDLVLYVLEPLQLGGLGGRIAGNYQQVLKLTGFLANHDGVSVQAGSELELGSGRVAVGVLVIVVHSDLRAVAVDRDQVVLLVVVQVPDGHNALTVEVFAFGRHGRQTHVDRVVT